MARKSIGELQDDIRHKDRRIAELRQEIDQLRDLVRRMEENIEDASSTIERWAETFQMRIVRSGADRESWSWKPFWNEHWQTIDDYNALVRDWNKHLPLINGRSQPVGRPLAASQAQIAQVLKLRRAGHSLRGIATETSLGLNTVRTIVGQKAGNDHTSKRHRARIERDRQRLLAQKRQRRTGAALPRQAQQVVEDGHALLKEAKDLDKSGRS